MEERQKHSVHSTLRESIIEHLFAGELLRRLWQRQIFEAEILKSEFDAGGYDLVLTYKNVTRHIQLKVGREGGKRADINVNLRLSEKPSGCVVWISVDDDLNLKGYSFFGNDPHRPLPDVATMKVVKHTKGNAGGIKSERDGHRLVKLNQFSRMSDLDHLLEFLLGKDLLTSG
ncbi:hypothetical protein G6M78_20460 [Agrobacterium tumefaciens]|uniref:hypothetical protein n=1 Tax=Agrobacterium tumefaciens TaxID=358 RepID=UPI0015746F4A|nr:hypothetical protein [Agrobacterium tumefaciens]NTE57439.1 hypothetical protein [Agrobacterium tumefaciens]NTE71259.1 hypothetical protein [Agrobacterium tumefaciens]